MIFQIKRRLARAMATVAKFVEITENPCGLTFIELMVVVAILGVLSLMAIPAYSDMKTLAKNARAIVEIRDIERELRAYSIDNGGTFPDHLDAIGRGGFKDPWGKPYGYSNFNVGAGNDPPRAGLFGPGDPLNTTAYFDLYSKGPDGFSILDDLNDSRDFDDIILAGDGAYVGLAKEYTF